jgi:hypothetical protein
VYWEEDSLSFVSSLAATDTRMYVAFFNIALDGSGTPDQHAAIAYAGAGASVVQWAAFTEQWNEVVRAAGLDYFKMATREAATKQRLEPETSSTRKTSRRGFF